MGQVGGHVRACGRQLRQEYWSELSQTLFDKIIMMQDFIPAIILIW